MEELEASGQIGFKSKYSAFDWDSKTPTVWLGHCGWNMKMRSITFASEGTRGSGSFTIGELFGGPDYAVVAQRICRARSAHNAGERSQLIKEMLNVRFDPNFSWMATTFHPLFGLNAALTG